MKFSRPYKIKAEAHDHMKCGSCNYEQSRLFCVDFGGTRPNLCANCLLEFIMDECGRVVFPPISKRTAQDRRVYK